MTQFVPVESRSAVVGYELLAPDVLNVYLRPTRQMRMQGAVHTVYQFLYASPAKVQLFVQGSKGLGFTKLLHSGCRIRVEHRDRNGEQIYT